MNLNELRDCAYKTACEHGWHEKKLSDETYLMLIITEIAEAVQADRKGRHADRQAFEKNISLASAYDFFLKGTVEDELADIIICCLSLAGHRHWDLQHVLDNVKDASDTAEVIGDETFAETAFYTCMELFESYDYSTEEAVLSVLVNVVEYCNYKGIDLWWHVEQKMRYNELRPYRHGGKAY